MGQDACTVTHFFPFLHIYIYNVSFIVAKFTYKSFQPMSIRYIRLCLQEQTMLLFAEEDLQNTHYSFLSLKRQIIVGTKYN